MFQLNGLSITSITNKVELGCNGGVPLIAVTDCNTNTPHNLPLPLI